MRSDRKAFGDRAEQIAAAALEREGFTIVDRNWRCRHGEIDLVVAKEGVCVFVEVRARRSTTHGVAAESITARKRAHLLAAVSMYELGHPELPDERRIDVITVDREGGRFVMRRIENAIEAD